MTPSSMAGQVLGLWSGKKTTHLVAIEFHISNFLEMIDCTHLVSMDCLAGQGGALSSWKEVWKHIRPFCVGSESHCLKSRHSSFFMPL